MKELIDRELRCLFGVYEITAETHLKHDLGADSLDMVEMCYTLEELADVVITDEQMESFETVGDIYRYFDVDTDG